MLQWEYKVHWVKFFKLILNELVLFPLGRSNLLRKDSTHRQYDKANLKLANHLTTVLKASMKTEAKFVRFFVPFCGSTQDLMYLYKKGFEVIGLGGIEKVCQEYFDKNELEFKRRVDQGVLFFQVCSKNNVL